MFLRLLFIFFVTYVNSAPVKYLSPSEVIKRSPAGGDFQRFEIFCYKGVPKSVFNYLRSVSLELQTGGESYNKYLGPTPDAVQREYEEQKSSWTFGFYKSQPKVRKADIKLMTFKQNCLGIESLGDYQLNLRVIYIDLWKTLCLLMGLLLFMSSRPLSQSVSFHYICGIGLGITASFMVVIYVLSKLIPRKSVMYGLCLTSWTVGLYFLQLIKDNLSIIFDKYRTYLMYYTLLSGSISFLVCYRWGPVKDERTRTLIKLSLQALGLLSVFFSTEYEEAAAILITSCVVVYYAPWRFLKRPLKRYFARRFPPKTKLLTEDEYQIQGIKETDKSLRELRRFCMSPECDQWATALKLKNVKRFASFVSGGDHVTASERFQYCHQILKSTDSESSGKWQRNGTSESLTPEFEDGFTTDDEDDEA